MDNSENVQKTTVSFLLVYFNDCLAFLNGIDVDVHTVVLSGI